MKKTITVILGLVLVCLIGISVYVVMNNDSKAPVITVVDKELVYMENTDTSVRIGAVKATDDTDGDVSDSIKIEKMAVSDDQTTIRVQYAAKDKSHNISKLTVTFGYTVDPNAPQEEEKSKAYNIVLINNLGVENLANTYAAKLRQDGHNIVSIGLSTDPPAAETVIFVENEGDGTELLAHFPGAKILVGNIANRINVNTNGADTYVILGWQNSTIPE